MCSGVGVEWSEAAGVESEEKERGTEEGEERTYIYIFLHLYGKHLEGFIEKERRRKFFDRKDIESQGGGYEMATRSCDVRTTHGRGGNGRVLRSRSRHVATRSLNQGISTNENISSYSHIL